MRNILCLLIGGILFGCSDYYLDDELVRIAKKEQIGTTHLMTLPQNEIYGANGYLKRGNKLIVGTAYMQESVAKVFNIEHQLKKETYPKMENALKVSRILSSFNSFDGKSVTALDFRTGELLETSISPATRGGDQEAVIQLPKEEQHWTLENFYTFLQAKYRSIHHKPFSIQFIIQDSCGQIKDSYPKDLQALHLHPEYCEPLGFISGDTLYATYSYPFVVFIGVVMWQIILTITISVLLIICILNLYHTIRNEKKSGEYRELFINNLVHDLKHPVENQIKVCYLLQELPANKQREFLEQGQKQLSEMLQSINRMLLQSTDAHGLRLNIKEFDIQDMLATLTQKDYWNTYSDKHIDIYTNFSWNNNIITGDYHFLYAVFQNLIDNALKYSGNQVEIHITGLEPDAQHIQINITDNGLGISSKNLKHIFERFNRGDHQNNRQIKGYGQGLYYARIIILAHGGQINIKSEEGKGSTISVTLPRKVNVKTSKCI